jgi:hypothetical protein
MRCYPKDGASIATETLDYLKDHALQPTEFRVEQGRLDEVFRNITQTEA